MPCTKQPTDNSRYMCNKYTIGMVRNVFSPVIVHCLVEVPIECGGNY